MNIAPENAKIKKEILRLKAWAMYPTSGGPMNMPTIPYVAINEMAIPGEYFFEPEARVKVIGMIDAVPKPVKQNPIMDGQKVGKVMARKIPKKVKQELTIKVLAIPILSTTRSDANRDRAMQIM